MAIQWGAWQSSGGISSRVGVDISTSTNASSQTVTARIYYENIGWIKSNYNTLTVSGGHSFNGAVAVNKNTGRVLVKTLTKTFTRPYGSASSQYTAVTFSGLPAGGTPRVTVRYSIPARAYSAPAAPRSTGAVRVSDTSADVSWIFDTTAAAPVSSVYIVRQQDDKGWDYSGAATASGTSGKLRLSGMAPGHRYRWAIRGQNKDANGLFGYTIWVYTTPLAPAGVTATRNGSDIDVTWTDANHYAYASFEVYKAGARVATVAAGTTTWTDVAPSKAGSHTYEVRAVYGDLRSAFTKSNTIMLLAPPLAPTNLSPDGGYVPDGEDITFAWTHNPADGTAQTQHRVRARKAGGSWVDFPATETAEQARKGGFSSFAGPGDVIEWEVQTRGEHATFGPYSDTASVTVAARPTVSINSPAADTVVNSSMVAVYASGPVEGFAWTATLTGDGPTQTHTGYCPDGVTAFSTTFSDLRDGGAYTVSVTTETEVKSIPATVPFTVDYPQPGEPTITGDWDAQTGGVLVNVANGATPTGGVSTSTIRLESLISRPGDAEEWQILDTLPASANGHTYVDHAARLHYDAIYRATAISSLGVESLPAVLNMGRNVYPANFVQYDGTTIRLRHNPGLEYTPERADITLVDLDDGNPVPVAILGPAQRNRVSLSGTLYDEEWATAEQQVRDLEWMAYTGGLVLVRTVDQAPMHGVISGMKISRHLSGTYAVSFNVDRAR